MDGRPREGRSDEAPMCMHASMHAHLGDEQVGADKDPPGYCLDDVCGRCTGDNTAGPCIADDGVQVSTQALLIRLCM